MSNKEDTESILRQAAYYWAVGKGYSIDVYQDPTHPLWKFKVSRQAQNGKIYSAIGTMIDQVPHANFEIPKLLELVGDLLNHTAEQISQTMMQEGTAPTISYQELETAYKQAVSGKYPPPTSSIKPVWGEPISTAMIDAEVKLNASPPKSASTKLITAEEAYGPLPGSTEK